MTDYVVMFPADNEAAWEAGTEADHQTTFDTDHEFAQLRRAPNGVNTQPARSGTRPSSRWSSAAPRRPKISRSSRF